MRNKYEYNVTISDIEEIGGLIDSKEIFVPCKGIRSIFVSNFGRIISKRTGKARLLSVHFRNGYFNFAIQNGKKRKSYFVHDLVAKNFLDVPTWIREGDTVETHHILKVNCLEPHPEQDYLSNLQLLPIVVHKMVDRIESLEVEDENGVFQKLDFVSVAEKLDISPYDLKDFIRSKKSKEKYQEITGNIKKNNALYEITLRVLFY